jgi:radical SAM superfamily enzyme YgiQ (UPF0313 family)
MHLYLINPFNSFVSVTKTKESRWNKYRIWKPLGLLVLAGMTPPDWEITVIDENLNIPDYSTMKKPDFVGLTAFTSQSPRAYELASDFRKSGVPVIMGGIHATMCVDEASKYVDSVVTGEAESIWPQVLQDARKGKLKPLYTGERLEMDRVPIARHDLLPSGYQFGSIQISRGCPLNCSFCSVTTFNGGKYRVRPIDKIIEEFKLIKEKNVLIVDDNLIGTKKEHVERAKELFRAMIKEKINKRWCTQVTINMADDEELLELAAKSGCFGVFIGFESSTREGLEELNKKFNISRINGFTEAVRRIQRHGIIVTGSFIMGLDVDGKGIGRQVAEASIKYEVDFLNLLYMTPLPGTRLWKEMQSAGRIAANNFPDDWKYYTLIFPVAKYKNLSWEDMIKENYEANSNFYSYRNIAKRMIKNLFHFRMFLITLIGNLTYRNNAVTNFFGKFSGLDLSRGKAMLPKRADI